MKKIILTVFCFSLSLFFTAFANAATLNVPQSYSSIDDAIGEAESGDVIMVGPGTYNENITVRKNIQIISTSGYGNTVIDGGNRASAVRFSNIKSDGVNYPKISGFTIQNGRSPEGHGGGVTVDGSDVVVENNRIYSNDSTMDGGGVLISNYSNCVVRNNIIDSNTALRFGGAIFVVGGSNPLLYNNTITNNNATGADYGDWGSGGGAIYVDGNSSPQIIKNTITNNHADHAGGAITLRVNCNSVIEDNTITNNNAPYGGGVHIETEGGAPTIKNNVISNNQANYSSAFSGSGFGGGISIYNNSQPSIVGNNISENFATQGGGGIVSSEGANSTVLGNEINKNRVTTSSGSYEGGGIYIASSSMTATNNVIAENEARIGGGIAALGSSNLNIRNNTIVKNIAPFDPSRPSGGGIFVATGVSSNNIFNNIITENQDYQVFEEHKKATIQFNLINDDNRGSYFNWDFGEIHDIDTLNSSALVSADNNIEGDENFLNASANDFHLLSGSSAINKVGMPVFYSYDIEYHFKNGDVAPDIGAYEYVTDSTITSPVYRFWSDNGKHHFYTISKDERDVVLNTYLNAEWRYEGEGFRSYNSNNCVGSSVHRFWSDLYRGHFYTISESEKDYVIANYDDSVWRYEGEAYCASVNSTSNATPLYRFWSNLYKGHFYTISEGEKNYVIEAYDDETWKYEGIGYYVYPN